MVGAILAVEIHRYSVSIVGNSLHGLFYILYSVLGYSKDKVRAWVMSIVIKGCLKNIRNLFPLGLIARSSSSREPPPKSEIRTEKSGKSVSESGLSPFVEMLLNCMTSPKTPRRFGCSVGSPPIIKDVLMPRSLSDRRNVRSFSRSFTSLVCFSKPYSKNQHPLQRILHALVIRYSETRTLVLISLILW